MGLPIGPTVLKYTLPSGVTASQTVNLVGGYNVVYIRMFRNRATVLTSNDPTALPPPVPVAIVPTVANPIPSQLNSVSPTVIEPAPAAAPAVTVTPVVSEPVSSAPSTNSTPASGNMEGVKPYEPPNLLNSFQRLFN